MLYALLYRYRYCTADACVRIGSASGRSGVTSTLPLGLASISIGFGRLRMQLHLTSKGLTLRLTKLSPLPPTGYLSDFQLTTITSTSH